MRKLTTLLGLLAVTPLALAAGKQADPASPQRTTARAPQNTEVKPAFDLTALSGERLRLSDYAGKWVLVNFWAPWCPRCKMDFPKLNELDARADFAVVGIAMDYGIDQGTAQQTVNRFKLRYPNVIGGNSRDPGSAVKFFPSVGNFYPMSYLYAPDGTLVRQIPGVINVKSIDATIQAYGQPRA